MPPPIPELTISGPEEGCPGDWAACLSIEQLLEFERYLWAARRWELDAWGRCGQGQGF